MGYLDGSVKVSAARGGTLDGCRGRVGFEMKEGGTLGRRHECTIDWIQPNGHEVVGMCVMRDTDWIGCSMDVRTSTACGEGG
jgi:hypothetical protein